MKYSIDLSKVHDLGHLKPASPDLMLNRVFGPATPWRQDDKLYGLVMNFVRLADLALDEYEYGRKATKAWWNEEIGSEEKMLVVRASSHFETCIVSMHRSVRHLQAIAAYAGTPAHFRAKLPLTKPVLSGTGDEEVQAVRGAIQHLEERILGIGHALRDPKRYPPVKFGDAVAPHARGDEQIRSGGRVQVIDRIELGDHRIFFADVARWLAELNKYAHELADAWW